MNIVSHVENHSFRSNRKARIQALFASFSRPGKHIRNGYVYVGFSRGVFKNRNFRENELDPPSPVRPLLEAFSCSARYPDLSA